MRQSCSQEAAAGKERAGRVLKPKLIAIDLLLVLAIAAIAWQGRLQLRQAQAERRENLNPAVMKPAAVPPAIPQPEPEPAQPLKYVDVATKNLFAKDRNPDVIMDPPKVEAAKPMPPLPLVYGVLGLPGGTRAIMADRKGAGSKPVKSGDMIGEFRIVSLDTKNIVFDWDGTRISENIDDLMDRSGPAAGGQQTALVPGSAIAAPNARTGVPPRPGGKPDNGHADRPCVAGDNSPPGTVADGYKKFGIISPFGVINCHWVPVQ